MAIARLDIVFDDASVRKGCQISRLSIVQKPNRDDLSLSLGVTGLWIGEFTCSECASMPEGRSKRILRAFEKAVRGFVRDE